MWLRIQVFKDVCFDVWLVFPNISKERGENTNPVTWHHIPEVLGPQNYLS
jgi:hypothetical protein